MFCGKCGTQNPDNAAFCKNCGANLAGQRKAPVKTAPRPRPQRDAAPARRQDKRIGIIAVALFHF